MAEEPRGPLATMFGTFYPKDYLVAILESEAAAASAIEALRQSGWAEEEARAFSGAFVIANHEAHVANRGFLESLAATFAADERAAVDQYIEEAKQGRHFVTVHATDAEHADKAGAILAGFGAFGMRHYGESTFREITTRNE